MQNVQTNTHIRILTYAPKLRNKLITGPILLENPWHWPGSRGQRERLPLQLLDWRGNAPPTLGKFYISPLWRCMERNELKQLLPLNFSNCPLNMKTFPDHCAAAVNPFNFGNIKHKPGHMGTCDA